MSNRQNGSALMIVILVVVSILLTGTGYFVWRKQSPQDKTSTSSSNESVGLESVSETEQPVEKTADLETITETNINLQQVGDEESLPPETPESFIEYIRIKLASFDCDMVSYPGMGYTVTKISPRFIGGGESCGGGAAIVWILTGTGWDELGHQSIMPCSTLTSRAIPSDFISECIDDNDWTKQIANPNGPLN